MYLDVSGITLTPHGKYRAMFRSTHIGCFGTVDEARIAYKEKIYTYYGIKEGVPSI